MAYFVSSVGTSVCNHNLIQVIIYYSYMFIFDAKFLLFISNLLPSLSYHFRNSTIFQLPRPNPLGSHSVSVCKCYSLPYYGPSIYLPQFSTTNHHGQIYTVHWGPVVIHLYTLFFVSATSLPTEQLPWSSMLVT